MAYCPECKGSGRTGEYKTVYREDGTKKRYQERDLCSMCRGSGSGRYVTRRHEEYSNSWGSGGGETYRQFVPNKKREGCFITTATLKHFEVNEDENKILELFREFRDSYVSDKDPNIILQYYQIAPIIVDCINKSSDCDKEYSLLWSNYINPSYKKLLEGKNDEAFDIYTQCVKDLEKKYGLLL